jgi:hypothetical protein
MIDHSAAMAEYIHLRPTPFRLAALFREDSGDLAYGGIHERDQRFACCVDPPCLAR